MFQNGDQSRIMSVSQRASRYGFNPMQMSAAKYAAIESGLEERLTIRWPLSMAAKIGRTTFSFSAGHATGTRLGVTWLSSPVQLKPKYLWDRLEERSEKTPTASDTIVKLEGSRR
jgi:hypothetical protein